MTPQALNLVPHSHLSHSLYSVLIVSDPKRWIQCSYAKNSWWSLSASDSIFPQRPLTKVHTLCFQTKIPNQGFLKYSCVSPQTERLTRISGRSLADLKSWTRRVEASDFGCLCSLSRRWRWRIQVFIEHLIGSDSKFTKLRWADRREPL